MQAHESVDHIEYVHCREEKLWDVLGCTSLLTSRFPRDCQREILRLAGTQNILKQFTSTGKGKDIPERKLVVLVLKLKSILKQCDLWSQGAL